MPIHSLAIYLVSSSESKRTVSLLASRTNPRSPLQSWWESSSRIVVERAAGEGRLEQGEDRDSRIFAYNREGKDDLIAVAITDLAYPSERVRTVLQALLDEFSSNVPPIILDHPTYISFPPLASYIARYDDPESELDPPAAEDAAHNAMPDLAMAAAAARERGEKIDELTSQLDRTRTSAKKFSEAARQINKKKPRCIIA